MTLAGPAPALLPDIVDRGTGARTAPPRVAGPLSVVQDAPERALAVLEADVPPLDAVVWLSVHLAAVEHVVHPLVARVLDDRAAVAALRSGTVGVQEMLRLLELFVTGDRAVLDEARAVAALVPSVQAQARKERRVLQRLADRLSCDEQRQVAAAYQDALQHAPTRPHPHSPHGARLAALAFHVNAWRDRVMDTLDSRHLPTPRPRREPLRSGRSTRGLLAGTSSAPTMGSGAALP